MLSKSELLNTVIGLYLSNEAVVQSQLPLILEALTTRRLLTDDQTLDDHDHTMRRKWTVRLNSLIQSKRTETRWAAIMLIKSTCEQSPSLLFSNIKTWINQLLGIVAKPESDMVHKAAINTLSYLFKYTHNMPELQREITQPNLPRFNHHLLGLAHRPGVFCTAIDALTTNMITFPTLSRSAGDNIQKLCLSQLDGVQDLDAPTLEKVSACLVAIHHTTNRVSSAQHWRDTVLKLIGSYHQALDILFDTVDEEWANEDELIAYDFVRPSVDPLEAFPILLRRIEALQICLSTALGTSSLVTVSVPVGKLVNLVCRAFSMFEGSLMNEFKDKKTFSALILCLPNIHQTTCRLLTSLLISSGIHMASCSDLLCRLSVRLLDEYKKQKSLKVNVYRLITLCMERFGFVFAQEIEKPLVASILEDIKVQTIKMAAVATNESKDAKKKRKRNDLTHSDTMAVQRLVEEPHEIQIGALKALEKLLACHGSSMDLNRRNALDSQVISRLLQITQKPFEQSLDTDQLIKEHLYPCLIASVTSPMQVQASILPFAVRLFSAGLNEQNLKLQMLCRQGVTICELITHPRMPPLQMGTGLITQKLMEVKDREAQDEQRAAKQASMASERDYLTKSTVADISVSDHDHSKKARMDSDPVSRIAIPTPTISPLATDIQLGTEEKDDRADESMKEVSEPVSTPLIGKVIPNASTTVVEPTGFAATKPDTTPIASVPKKEPSMAAPAPPAPAPAARPAAAVETFEAPQGDSGDEFEMEDFVMDGPDSDEE
ncbi:hypothetical protein DM01DRAFT_1405095 [Hesseltinella vesiculosa]|uniref:Pre-rRNA-processing protein RIX1 n=1 Tax=Hesseltinella vesiculosa TaxID=101127 RepID=A0A1X2GRF4_9FUNG|nr:hypothetical protein DM01DRAFT_1405095 [Hesseltinella vesiculosa]